MSLPAVQARREKHEAISYRRPTQNPRSSKRQTEQHGTPDKRQESKQRYEQKQRLLQ